MFYNVKQPPVSKVATKAKMEIAVKEDNMKTSDATTIVYNDDRQVSVDEQVLIDILEVDSKLTTDVHKDEQPENIEVEFICCEI